MGNANIYKPYILGLFVGGGRLSSDTFIVELPFKKWGEDAGRMSAIGKSILTNIKSHFTRAYNIEVTYELGNGKWLIKPIGNVDMKSIAFDLEELGLPTSGFILNSADLSIAAGILKGINAEKFVSGIFDARASLTKTHRRFTSAAPIVSIEIPGSTRNFQFTMQLSSWLTSLGSVTDQILYNHPTQHSGSNPYYKSWKKGFKIRFLAETFLTQHSFILQAKAQEIVTLSHEQIVREQEPCKTRKITGVGPIAVHQDIASSDLPAEVRSKLFFHYFHVCAVLGCPYAPKKEVKKWVDRYKSLISFFPVLAKADISELSRRYDEINNEFYSSTITNVSVLVDTLLEDNFFHKFSNLKQGLAYLFSEELNGNRHKGEMLKILDDCKTQIVTISTFNESFDCPIMVSNPQNDRAFICSAISNSLNQKLIDERIHVDGLSVKVL